MQRETAVRSLICFQVELALSAFWASSDNVQALDTKRLRKEVPFESLEVNRRL